MAEDDPTAAEDEALDASYKPDAAVLDGDEADFAKALGFGLAGSEGASSHATDEEAAPAAADDDDDDDADAAADEVIPDEAPSAREAASEDDEAVPEPEEPGVEEVEAAAVPDEAPPLPEDSPGEASDDDSGADAASVAYEDIHPRPASEGMQETIQARADDVLARSEAERPVAVAAGSVAASDAGDGGDAQALARLREEVADRDRALAAALADLDATHAELAAVRAEPQPGAADEKELEEIRVELDSVTLERDQLIDQLAATSGQLVHSQRSAEQLEASLRAARGALVPLPEGERALRAEVIGLRGRLDDAGQENVRLASEVASVATELAIATARVEDRQHEIDYHADRARDLENELAEKDRQTEDAIARHREALDLATRLQADNTELRSAQASLEETLQARDLEIAAREEHLRVTREGLSTRDTQLVDLKETLEQERHRIEALEADLERAGIEKGVLLDKVARREMRIATLTETLGRIEDAMGQRLQLPAPERPALAQAEWTRAQTPTASAAPTSVPPRVAEAPAPAEADEPEPLGTQPEPELVAVEPEPVVTDAEASVTAPVCEDGPLEAEGDDDLPVSRETAPAEPTPSEPESVESVIEALDVPPEEEPDDETAAEPDPPVHILNAAPALPSILGRWRDERLEELEEADAESVADFLAQRLVAHLGAPTPEAVYLKSLGGALPDAEARLVAALQSRGVEGIRMEVLDVDEAAAEARRARIELACLGEVIDVRVGDLPDWDAEAPCHAILLSDALHAQASPDVVLDHLAPSLARGALLLFAGRVGAGPVQLSASTLMRLEELWQFLPEPLASAEGLGQAPFRGDDGGTPAVEIDPAAALVDRFEATALVGFGHLADLVVGPSRGFAMADEDEDARQLLQSIVAIDESRGITEALPPRHGVGVFAHGSVGRTECYGLPWPCLADALR